MHQCEVFREVRAAQKAGATKVSKPDHALPFGNDNQTITPMSLSTPSDLAQHVLATSIEAENKRIVRAAFDVLFNQKDYEAAERFWSPNYIQHSAYVAPGRKGLFDLVKHLPPGSRHEVGAIFAEGDFVIVHSRFANVGLAANWIAADIVRMQDGILVEHWDIIQDEATRAQSKSGNPMFGTAFPS
jgi:predicted SnoaL-like aldol condensation-catalyzing enzyme